MKCGRRQENTYGVNAAQPKTETGTAAVRPALQAVVRSGLVAAATLGATVFFQVETIAVVGNSRYTAQEVIDASGVQIGDNLFQMNKNQISQRILQQLPYVGEVSPQRGLPSTLTIQVTEISAAARVEVYQDVSAQAEPSAEDGSGDDGAADSSAQGDSSQTEGEEPLTLADQPWLISTSGKLLETLR